MENITFIFIALFVLAFGLISRRLEKTVITPPMVFVLFGLLMSNRVLGLIELDVESEVVTRIYAVDPDEVMPPPESKRTLSDQQKKLLRDWISAGAKYDAHWAWTAPKRPVPPRVEHERGGVGHRRLQRHRLRRLDHRQP